MSDIFCPKCGEPWDLDCLHDEIAARNPDLPWVDDITNKYDQKLYDPYFNAMRKEFQRDGCVALKSYGGGHNEETMDPPRNSVYGSLMELAGDDIDFAVSMMEDAERYGLV